MASYVDLYLIPVPKKKLSSYKSVARRFGKIIRDYGVTEYREFVADDLKGLGGIPYTKVVKLKAGETLVASYVVYKSKAHRTQVIKKMMQDPRMKKMTTEPMVFDMKRMTYGGFKTFVEI